MVEIEAATGCPNCSPYDWRAEYPTDSDRLRPITVDYGRLEDEEIAIVEFLKKSNKLTRKQAVELLDLQRTKVTDFLGNLLKKEIIERHGQGRGTHYRLKRRQS